MKYPKESRTYCPTCKKHTDHKVRLVGKGTASNMAIGTRKHERKLLGHGGKRAGKQTPKKQGKRQKIVMECNTCHKKHERVIGARTKKKLELA